MNQEQQLKLQAFLDGELPENEAREILAWTQRDSAASGLLAELKNTRAALAKSGPHLTVPETREFYWSKIEREIRRLEPRADAAPQISIFAKLRRFLLPAGALAALVIAGLLVHFQGANDVADSDAPTVETSLANSGATTYRDTSEDTTLVWFSSAADENSAQNETPSAIN